MTQAEALTNQCCWGHNLNLANIKWLRQVCKQKPSQPKNLVGVEKQRVFF